jgi:hypothetical protein
VVKHLPSIHKTLVEGWGRREGRKGREGGREGKETEEKGGEGK